MQFPESWLRSLCNPPLSSAELAHTLTMAGFEVEDAHPVAPPFTGVVVAQILSAEPHPDADRLRVCQVDAGQGGAPLQIVCGAPNARAGIRVPLATVGAELPPAEAGGKPFAIKVGKLRGVESFGMLCSARELGITSDHAGLLELAPDAPVGGDIRAVLNLDDTVFALKLTPNLGHVLSVYGVARELAAITGAPLTPPPMAPVAATHDAVLPVRIDAPDLCGRFAGRIVRSINPDARTPDWMVQRLQACGQRSISPLVDISNYVMFELGRPSHAYDLAAVDAAGLVARWASEGESLELLNGQTPTLQADVGVVADAAGPEGIAGIMGGARTAVSSSTRDVYLEAAFWWPEAVAGRSRRLGFATEAGHRFERGVDAHTLPAHLERITALVLEVCGGEPGPLVDTVARLPERAPVRLRASRAAKVIGMPLTVADCAGVFARLGFAHTVDGDVLHVTPPSWRFDITIEEDLIEEVVRLIGYDTLPTTPPQGAIAVRRCAESQRRSHAVRRAVAALGYQETINYSFIDARWEADLHGNADPIRVLNPIAAHMAVMRSSLIGGLVATARYNLARKARRVRVFELGRVFARDAAVLAGSGTVAGIAQPMRVAGLAVGPAAPLQWSERERAVDFFDAKADVEALLAPRVATFETAKHPAMHPGRCAAVRLDGVVIGHVGELHPRWVQAHELGTAPVLFELDLPAVQARPVPQFAPVPRQLAVTRDVALVVPEHTAHSALIAALQGEGGSAVACHATLFDVFRPASPSSEIAAGEVSLALRLTLQGGDETLTDAQIDAAVHAAVARAAQAVGARLRSGGGA